MFWEYHADRTGALLDTLDAALRGEDVVPLSGVWRFELDPSRRGARRVLGEPHAEPTGSASPASSRRRDSGTTSPSTRSGPDRSSTGPSSRRRGTSPTGSPANVKVPFWLQPDKHYVGAAWYERDVVVPPEWKGRRVVLHLERPHWQTLVWVDGNTVGSNDSLGTPHEHDLGHARAREAPADDPGGQPAGRRRRASTPTASPTTRRATGTASWAGWSCGPWRRCGSTTCRSSRTSTRGRRSCAGGSATRRARRAAGCCGSTCRRRGPRRPSRRRRRCPGTRSGRCIRDRGRARRVRAHLGRVLARSSTAHRHARGGRGRATRARSASGCARLRTQGTQFVVNGRKTFFRGTLECAIFPRTGHPPTDVASWRRIVRIAKAHGLNHDPLPLLVPAGGRLRGRGRGGLLLPGRGRAPGPTARPASAPACRSTSGSTRETDRILKAYGNHPSFVLFAYGNEPAGRDARVPRATGSSTGRRGTRAGSTRAPRAGRRSRRTSST